MSERMNPRIRKRAIRMSRIRFEMLERTHRRPHIRRPKLIRANYLILELLDFNEYSYYRGRNDPRDMSLRGIVRNPLPLGMGRFKNERI